MAQFRYFAAIVCFVVFFKSSTSLPILNSNCGCGLNNLSNLGNMSPSASITPLLTVNSPKCGCSIPAELVPALQYGDVSLQGDLPIGGTIKVAGCFPVYGLIAVDGNLPSSGTAVVNTACGVGQNCGCN